MVSDGGAAEIVNCGEGTPCATPRKAIGVESPDVLFVPTTTVSRVPVSVTCWLRLLPGHAAADQLFPFAS